VTPHPGELLRVGQVDVPTSVPSYAWQVIHGSSDVHGRPRDVSGTVLCPHAAWSGRGPRPVVSFDVAILGLGRTAVPSRPQRCGTEGRTRVDRALSRGWAVGVPDATGPGFPEPHLLGSHRSGGHALLDLARATLRLLPELALASPIALWGYSLGGLNAARAAALHPSYAPELRLVALAAGGMGGELGGASPQPLDVPMLLHHAQDDDIVPLELGRSLAQAHLLRGTDLTWLQTEGDHAAGAECGADAAVAWLGDRLGEHALGVLGPTPGTLGLVPR
jgi:predicted esterase